MSIYFFSFTVIYITVPLRYDSILISCNRIIKVRWKNLIFLANKKFNQLSVVAKIKTSIKYLKYGFWWVSLNDKLNLIHNLQIIYICNLIKDATTTKIIHYPSQFKKRMKIYYVLYNKVENKWKLSCLLKLLFIFVRPSNLCNFYCIIQFPILLFYFLFLIRNICKMLNNY